MRNDGKLHSNITSRKRVENLRSPIVVSMAARMSYLSEEGFKDIYRDLGYYIGEAKADIERLVKQGIVKEKQFRESGFYYYYGSVKTGYYIPPEVVIEILKVADERDVYRNRLNGVIQNSFQRCIDLNPADQYNFVKAIYFFLKRDKEWEELVNKCKSVFEVYAFCDQDKPTYITLFIDWLMAQVEMRPIFDKLDNETLHEIRRSILRPMAKLSQIDSTASRRWLFYDDVDTPAGGVDSLIYTLVNELLVDGKIDDLLNRYKTPSLTRDYMIAVKSLLAGDFMPLLEISNVIIKDHGGVNALMSPAIWMFLAAAMFADPTEASLKFVGAIAKSLRNESFLSILYNWKTTRKIVNKRLKDALDNDDGNPGAGAIFYIFALRYSIFEERDKQYSYLYDTLNSIVNCRYRYLKLLLASCGWAKLSEEALEKETGMNSFFSIGGRKPRWLQALEKMQEKYAPAHKAERKSAAQTLARVAYKVDITDEVIQPVLQKSTNGTTWTAGRNIALKNMAKGGVKEMTEQDLRVAACIYEDYTGYGSANLDIDYARGIYALAGHPYVFSSDPSMVKIEIVDTPLQLSVSKDRTGKYRVASNVDTDKLFYDRIAIDSSNPASIAVTKLTEEQLAILKQFREIGTLPKEAAEPLAATLSVIASKMTVMSDLLGKDEKAEQVEASSTLALQLLPDGESIRANVYAKPFVSAPPYLVPGKGAEYISGIVDGRTVQTKRDLGGELVSMKAFDAIMEPYVDSSLGQYSWLMTIEDTLGLLNMLRERQDVVAIEWPEGVKMRVSRPAVNPSDIKLSLRKIGDWFEVSGNIVIDENTTIKINDILNQLGDQSSRFIRLGDNEYVALSEQLAKLLRKVSKYADGSSSKRVRLSPLNISLLEQLDNAGIDLKADKEYRQLLKRINSADKTTIKIPRSLNAELREYQKEGYLWLSRLYLWGAGACLADDMGLGKTLQTIALMLAQKDHGPSLVVAPTSVILNWRDEIERFAPSLSVKILNRCADKQRAEMIESAQKGDVVITSYGLLVTCQEFIAAKEWNIVTLDEAHTIKNRSTKMSQAAMQLKAAMRVALTGTPLQNRLAEIWNIFHFLNPGLLGSFQSFSDRFIMPIERDRDKEMQRLLKQMISPFLLRRTKNDVLNDLPEKTEITLSVTLSDEERAIYEKLRSQAQLMVDEGEVSPMQALAEITRLRQAVCDPRLVYPNLNLKSSKAEAFMDLVSTLRDNGHRALVFSQFTSHLALIKKALDKEGYTYLYLDGSTPAAERAKLVEQFQDGEMPLFLISLKAGGLGLNLTAADYVIHLDPWWNPAIEDQASDRSYRIGQTKPVTVYKLIAEDTIEDRIIELHAHKKSLADALLEGADMSARLTKEDILNILS